MNDPKALSELIDKLTSEGKKTDPDSVLQVCAKVLDVTVKYLVDGYIEGAIKNVPPEWKNDIKFWMGMDRGMEYMLLCYEENVKLKETVITDSTPTSEIMERLHNRILLAIGMAVVAKQIKDLKN